MKYTIVFWFLLAFQTTTLGSNNKQSDLDFSGKYQVDSASIPEKTHIKYTKDLNTPVESEPSRHKILSSSGLRKSQKKGIKNVFILNLTYRTPLSQVDDLLDSHIDFLKEQYKKGYFILSGKKNPRTGGVIIAKASSLDEIKKIISKDPFTEVAEYQIIEIVPSMASKKASFLLEPL